MAARQRQEIQCGRKGKQTVEAARLPIVAAANEAGIPTVLILMYFILPIWLTTRFADCHRASHIETTPGRVVDPSPDVRRGRCSIAGGDVFEINAMIIGLMIIAFFIHEVTAIWDSASTARMATSIEQSVRSF